MGFWLSAGPQRGGGGIFPGPPDPTLQLSDAELGYYSTNILPLQQQAFRQVTDPTAIKQQIATAEGDVAQQFSNLPAAFQRQMAASGIAPTAAQTANFKKQAALNQGIATAAAANQTRAGIGAQQAAVVGY